MNATEGCFRTLTPSKSPSMSDRSRPRFSPGLAQAPFTISNNIQHSTVADHSQSTGSPFPLSLARKSPGDPVFFFLVFCFFDWMRHGKAVPLCLLFAAASAAPSALHLTHRLTLRGGGSMTKITIDVVSDTV